MTSIIKNSDETKPSLLKQAALQIIAGGSAGFVEVCIMHPLDLVKTRLQIQNKSITNPGKTVNQVCAMCIVILTCNITANVFEIFLGVL